MHPVLATALHYLETEVAPRAQAIDTDPGALEEAFAGLGARDLLALRRPIALGGPELSEAEFRTFQEDCARASGSLAFLQTQHQSAGSIIGRGDNEALKAEAIPGLGDGTRRIGIGFSQLRRSGPPIMRATPEGTGYILDGHVPWVTGFGFFPEFVIGAALPDGRAVFGLVPFVPVPGVRFSPPMRLAAMESAQTVTADFEGYMLQSEHVVSLKPEGWIHQNDMINVTLQGYFALGCARAGVDIVRRAAERRNLEFAAETADRLASEIDACRVAMASAQAAVAEDVSTQEKVEIRAWAIDLAVRCAHAGVAASSGAANDLSHPAQRVYREALVYTVSAQTTPIMRATLDRLVGRGVR